MNERTKRWSRYLGLAIASVFVLAACGSTVPPDPDAGPPDSGDTRSQLPADFPIALYQGEEVVGGQEVLFSEMLDLGKPVVLNLWAGLCPPCRLEMPDFQEVNTKFEDKVILFGLDVGPFTNLGSNEDGQALVQELGVTYPTGTTTEAEVVRAYGLLGMPTTYFVKPDGQVLRTWTGLLTKDKLSELVEELLVASTGS
jgi:thiol-disulfide isomerase/thioredoxin